MRQKNSKMLSLGIRIKQARENAGFTQEQLAERIGISRATIARYESGEIEPKLKNLIAIAEQLQISTDYLLGLNMNGYSQLPDISDGARLALIVLIRELRKDKED